MRERRRISSVVSSSKPLEFQLVVLLSLSFASNVIITFVDEDVSIQRKVMRSESVWVQRQSR